MDQSQLEAYENGWYHPAELYPQWPNVPPWATDLGFCMEGCYAYISLDDLAKDCKSVRRLSGLGGFAYLELARQPASLSGYSDFFTQLESRDVNLIPRLEACSLRCYGATMSRSRDGKLVLNGRFQVSYEAAETGLPVQVNTRGSLVLSLTAGTHATLSTSGVVPYFETKCLVTMDPSDFSEHWAAFAKVDNPLFGTFSTTVQRAPSAPDATASPMPSSPSRRPSLARALSNRLSLPKPPW